jgi:uncharacterized membrane protein YvbJ
MEFCSRCGQKLPENAYFCPKCGVRTRKGIEARVHAPTEDLREAFSKAGQEMEKAFKIAAKEIQEAFNTARESIRESSAAESVICTHCGETNRDDSSFCHKCGKKLD